jgi:very-short-patch-repair endonuclease
VREVASEQAGVVTRSQVLHCGLSVTWLMGQVKAGRWQRIHRGVYATFNGSVPRMSALWAAVLCAGRGAMLSHETAAELAGLAPPASRLVHVMVPVDETPAPIPGVVIHRSAGAAGRRHPTRMPPQTRIEDTVIDLTQSAGTLEDAISWLARAVGGRFTTAARLSACLAGRRKVRWRSLLCASVDDVAAGCHSLLELSYLRDVERAHRLPRSQRQVRRASIAGYDDVRYPEYATRVELDGRAAHPEHERWRDMRRDNAATVEGDNVLRFGLSDIHGDPCHAAAQVATVLRTNGWTGNGRRCGRPGCTFGAASALDHCEVESR